MRHVSPGELRRPLLVCAIESGPHVDQEPQVFLAKLVEEEATDIVAVAVAPLAEEIMSVLGQRHDEAAGVERGTAS